MTNADEYVGKRRMACLDMENINFELERQELLDAYKIKQNFRVSIGKSRWILYEKFNPAYNLREILQDEIVIEFDSTNLEYVMRAINATGIALFNGGYYFEWWDHGGKSPHLHIKNLGIPAAIKNDKDKLRNFKKAFIRTYVPAEFQADESLCGVHLVAIEWALHWKGCYGIKKLISIFDGANKNSWGVCAK